VNRRKFERTAVDPIEIVIEEIEAGMETYANVAVVIEEVSLMGIKFKADVKFEINDIVSFKLPSLDVLSLVNGRIAWKEALQDSFRYGLEIFAGESH
jgi:hypothetical protein